MTFLHCTQSSSHPRWDGSDTLVGKETRMRRNRGVLAGVSILGIFALSLLPTQAISATATATFAVSASIVAGCGITASPLAFGAYTGVQADAESSLSVNCTNTTAYSVGLGAGTSGGTATARQMSGTPAGILFYALYSDVTRAINWGDTGGTGLITGTGSGSAQVIPVYGRIVAGQLSPPGTYADTMTATVTF
ncbi:spore coat protein U domain-containing protein [Pseudomonas lini]|uniref:Spore coat protein U (SCPU) domain-containing protein n=2 Tax=Pseudomonas TaxID=286 RepID=A0A1H2AHG0_9PSED|nr:spore coat protein U domain-containing protein [Pseudomonas lini]MDT9678700.1 spore coat protein U domain-containing protein [Pseudomonas sp. JV414]NSX12438.1 spore coat protein U domain-containing protein [Pseudomonas lini]SDT45423.1 Spore coat protein U (SCPU) domain-containing protein [Pseudomonas lini]